MYREVNFFLSTSSPYLETDHATCNVYNFGRSNNNDYDYDLRPVVDLIVHMSLFAEPSLIKR